MKRVLSMLVCCVLIVSCAGPKSDSKSETKKESQQPERTEAKPEDSDKAEASRTVEISPEAQKRSGIVIASVDLVPLPEYLRVTGTVQPVDSRLAHVHPLARGRLQDVLVKVGDRVTSGQALARFDNIEAGELSTQYEAARAELQKLKIQLAAQTRQMQRNQRLAEIGAIPQKEYEFSQAEQQGLAETIHAQESTVAGIEARLRRFGLGEPNAVASSITVIRSPFAGVVTRTEATPGQVVDSSTELFSIADLSTVYIQAQVFEKDLGAVRLGQLASISVESRPGRQFQGRVVSISDLIDPQTRTAAVRCKVDNRNAQLKLDMLAAVELVTSGTRNGLAVPSDAVQSVEGKPVVFVAAAEGKFVVRQVESGRESAGRTEIMRGLKKGERIVARGAFAVKSVLLSKELGEGKE